MKDSRRDCCECLRLGFSSLSVFDAFKPCWLKCLCQASNPLECSLLTLQCSRHSFSIVKDVWCHRHTTVTCTDAVESSTLNPSTITDDETFLAEVSTLEASTTGVLTIEMSTVGASPDTYSDEYYSQSSESKDGFCPNADWTRTPLNIARTCGSFDFVGASCSGLNAYPNATISDYRSISANSAMQNEIYHCGPNACGIDAMPLLNWASGTISTAGSGTAHVISIVGSRPTRPKRNPLDQRLVLCPQIMSHEPA